MSKEDKRDIRRGRKGFFTSLSLLIALIVNLLPGLLPGQTVPTASAHNLDSRMVSMYFDPATQALINGRVNSSGNPLLFNNDVVGMIIKVVPTDGTNTGVGAYVDFYLPNGVTVLDAAYMQPDGSGGYVEVPMKGQALMPDVGAGGDPAISLVGISRGPNILGQTNNLVTSGNVNQGTLPGIYGDIGIFYATIPETVYWAATC